MISKKHHTENSRIWPICVSLALICPLLLATQGCKTWHTLEFQSPDQPIQLSPGALSMIQESLGYIDGYYTHLDEGDIRTEGENWTLRIGGRNRVVEDIHYEVYTALDADRRNTVMDGEVTLSAETGISPYSVVMAAISRLITGKSARMSSYDEAHIYFNGQVYSVDVWEFEP